MGDRLALTEFWENLSDNPTVQTMMLNKFSDKIDEQDRQDILASLPHFEDMNVVDLGAGIGRFTTLLAAKAGHVTAVDIVESFIAENRKINGHMGNVSFKTGEASVSKIDENSVDLVFTNWLLMYLTDIEVITLLKHVLVWLNVGGYMHIRESCSEPSKRTLTTSEVNPTHYRHICQYLQLLQSIAIKDDTDDDLWYKFDVIWSKSVNTYVEIYGNWRQGQILVRKIAMKSAEMRENDRECHEKTDNAVALLKLIKTEALADQAKFDKLKDAKLKLFNAISPVSNYLCKILHDTMLSAKIVLNLIIDENFCASSFDICQKLGCKVFSVETSLNAYNAGLEKAVAMQDKRIRFNFVPDLKNRDWALPKNCIDIAIGCCLFKEQHVANILQNLKMNLARNGRIILLEEAASLKDVEIVLENSGLNAEKIVDISVDVKKMFKEALPMCIDGISGLSVLFSNCLINNNRWFVITAF